MTRLELKRARLEDLISADELLGRCELLTHAGEDVSRRLLAVGVARRYTDRACLVREGEGASSFFLVLKGEVRLTARQGQETVEVGAASKGDILGEEQVVDPTARPCFSAISDGELHVAEFPREMLLQVVAENAPLLAYLTSVWQRRHRAMRELSDFLNRW